jgi:hypothetical protein
MLNTLACICAIDRAVLPTLMGYWAPEVDVCGISELVANALVIPGEKEKTVNLRGEPILRKDVEPDEWYTRPDFPCEKMLSPMSGIHDPIFRAENRPRIDDFSNGGWNG